MSSTSIPVREMRPAIDKAISNLEINFSAPIARLRTPPRLTVYNWNGAEAFSDNRSWQRTQMSQVQPDHLSPLKTDSPEIPIGP